MAGLFHKISEHFQEEAAERQQQQAHRDAYAAAVHQLTQPNADIKAIISSLPDSSAYSATALRNLDDGVFRQLANGLLADGRLTADEESDLLAVGPALGVDPKRLNTAFPDIAERIVVGQINDGRLPVLNSPGIVLRKGEVAHMQAQATLLKWQAVTEWKGGSNGFSFRITKGVYYRTGQTRGHLVTKGQSQVPADTGTFTVTSQRAVFTGARRALEFAFPKLLNVEVFTDGLRLAVSNRQQPSTLLLARSEVAAAIINAAAQKLS